MAVGGLYDVQREIIDFIINFKLNFPHLSLVKIGIL